MKEKQNEYNVTIDMVWSKEYKVKAKTEAEAKQKAWERFTKRPAKAWFKFWVDLHNW